MFTNSNVLYDRRVNNLVERAGEARIIFPHWQGKDECWLFLAAHDDDIVTGAGLTLLAGLEEKADVHAVITANGNMGYCRPEYRESIASIRKEEAMESFRILGLGQEKVHFLDFDDCSFYLQAGRRLVTDSLASSANTVIAGATGLQNSYTWILRKVRPTRVFLPTPTDIHPDHQMTTREMMISIFHAQGDIWPELGPKLEQLPLLYEYSTYSDFITQPTIRIRATDALWKKKLAGIMAYKSQEQIDMLIELQKKSGAQEYLREVRFDILEPHKYDRLFG